MAFDHKKNIRMIALDLDDTTLRTDKSMAPRTRDALEKAAGRGVIVVVSTGRVLNSLPDNVKSVSGVRFVINSNGACVNDLETGETLYRNNLDPEKVIRIADLLAGYDFPVEVFTGGEAYMNESDYNKIKADPSKYRSAEYILWSRRPVPDVLAVLRRNADIIENISVNFRTPEEKTMMRGLLEEIGGITVTSSVYYNLEIGGAGTSKAEALRVLMKRFGISADELMACGDSPNDAAMIKMAGIGVAVANANEKIKATADHVTDSNDEDGVAKAIEKFVLT